MITEIAKVEGNWAVGLKTARITGDTRQRASGNVFVMHHPAIFASGVGTTKTTRLTGPDGRGVRFIGAGLRRSTRRRAAIADMDSATFVATGIS